MEERGVCHVKSDYHFKFNTGHREKTHKNHHNLTKIHMFGTMLDEIGLAATLVNNGLTREICLLWM